MIQTLLDNDFYQFTMAQAIWKNGKADLQVRYEFRNRTFAVPLAARLDLDMLEKYIDSVRQLRFGDPELNYLRSTFIFDDKFLEALRSVRLPEVKVSADNGHLVMTYEGNWIDGIFWETMLLSIVNEMYYERFGQQITSEGLLRLGEKIEYLQERKTIKFVEFGTRRRFSAAWQHFVTHTLQDAVPDLLLGTSNVHLAKELGLRPIGTMAHQLFMIYTALSTPDPHDPIAAGQEKVLLDWARMYAAHPEILIALPDTYSTKAFIQKLRVDSSGSSALDGFTGFRQDSGDPIEVGRRLEALCHSMGIPPKIIFSDSLDVRKMSVIEDAFPGVETLFGWGTDLTNDLGFEPLSIVIKPCAVKWLTNDMWLPCVKISDDPQKATGDPQTVRKYQTEWWGVK